MIDWSLITILVALTIEIVIWILTGLITVALWSWSWSTRSRLLMRLWLIMLTVTVVIVSGYAHGYDRVTNRSRLWSHLILSWWYDHNRDHDLVANRPYYPFHLSSSWSINATAIFSLSILIGCDRIDCPIKSGQPSAKVSNNLVECDQSTWINPILESSIIHRCGPCSIIGSHSHPFRHH